jgi:hypothetical protein
VTSDRLARDESDARTEGSKRGPHLAVVASVSDEKPDVGSDEKQIGPLGVPLLACTSRPAA